MIARRLASLFPLLFVVGGLAGCAGSGAPEDSASTEQGALETAGQRAEQASDDEIKAKLGQILHGVMFTSESDYEYTVLEVDGHGVKKLSTKALRANLAAIIKQKSSSHRDIAKATCRAEKLAIADALKDAESTDPDDHDSKQAGLAVKYMTEQLRGVVGYTFGTNASGDEDDEGPVVYVYVGISRTSGKLIAIMTEAVYT